MSAEKLEARKQWNATPCGVGDYLDQTEYGSIEFFDEVRPSRYERTDEWMPRVIPFAAARGKRVLEIGHAMGTDLLSFARAGAEVYGIGITEEHHRLARSNFELHQVPVTLKLCDAADIDFPSEYFDIVYSHGVLHHTPDTVRCISEAFRVLKPGGTLVLSLYRTRSAFYLFAMLGYRGLMATLERGADGVNIRPLVKTYRRSQLKHILSDFSSVRFQVAHFKREHIPGVGRIIPGTLERLLESLLGWSLIAFAVK